MPVHDSSTSPLWSSTTTWTSSLVVAEEADLPVAGRRRSGWPRGAGPVVAQGLQVTSSSLLGDRRSRLSLEIGGEQDPGRRPPAARSELRIVKTAAARAARQLGEGPQLVADEVERHREGHRDRLGAAAPGTSTTSISISRAIRLIPSARTLTVKKRAAWKPACSPLAWSKVQWRFQRKLLVTATTKAAIAAGMWWTSRSPVEQPRTRSQVDEVADRPTTPNWTSWIQFSDFLVATADPLRCRRPGSQSAPSTPNLRNARGSPAPDRGAPTADARRALRPAADEQQRRRASPRGRARRGCRRRCG